VLTPMVTASASASSVALPSDSGRRLPGGPVPPPKKSSLQIDEQDPYKK